MAKYKTTERAYRKRKMNDPEYIAQVKARRKRFYDKNHEEISNDRKWAKNFIITDYSFLLKKLQEL